MGIIVFICIKRHNVMSYICSSNKVTK